VSRAVLRGLGHGNVPRLPGAVRKGLPRYSQEARGGVPGKSEKQSTSLAVYSTKGTEQKSLPLEKDEPVLTQYNSKREKLAADVFDIQSGSLLSLCVRASCLLKRAHVQCSSGLKMIHSLGLFLT
jgi:hypothetical protein